MLRFYLSCLWLIKFLERIDFSNLGGFFGGDLLSSISLMCFEIMRTMHNIQYFIHCVLQIFYFHIDYFLLVLSVTENSYPLQYSGLENSMGCIVHGVEKRVGCDWATFTFTGTFPAQWLPFPAPGDFPHPGTEPTSPALQADSLSPSHQGSPLHSIMHTCEVASVISSS